MHQQYFVRMQQLRAAMQKQYQLEQAATLQQQQYRLQQAAMLQQQLNANHQNMQQ